MILKKMKYELAMLGSLAMILLGCGSSNQNATYAYGSCSSGYVYTTSYGCQPQGSTACSSGYVSTTNYGCVPGNVTTTTTTGYGSCSSGYVYTTSYGCQPQAATSCASGYVSTSTYGCVPGTTTTTTQYQGTCSVGYVQTQYGCLQQGSCMAGYGYYNGWCFKSVYMN